ncbi:unnamed protein product [Blepharisma stoltei]|uniref:C2H2-type domain-containing protein n=1 Tax=Blepharisma stoltei TaxID=1481888 RepID=A0AAU9J097_9CILI|nr:unnamed protein product [Blepharisma stoltei]
MDQSREKLPKAMDLPIQNYMTPFTCHICNKSFKGLEDLVKHIGANVWKLTETESTFSLPENSMDNLNIHEASNYKYSCSYCSRTFDNEKGLKLHSGKKHPQQEKSELCPRCGNKFVHKYALDFHIKQVHEKSTRVVCTKCKKSFYNKYVLQRHFQKCNPFHSLI